MSKHPMIFVKARWEPNAGKPCDDCGREIADIGEGQEYWNPNPRALIRHICSDCYTFRCCKKQERYDARMAELRQRGIVKDPPAGCPICGDPIASDGKCLCVALGKEA